MTLLLRRSLLKRYSTLQTPTTPPTKRKLSTLTTLTVSSVFAFLGGYVSGTIYPPSFYQLLYPKPAPPPPVQHSQQSIEISNEIENKVNNLDIVKSLRSDKSYYESRPYTRLNESVKANSLTAGALRGGGRLAIPPVVFSKEDDSEAIIILHVGRGLCGHDGIIHGGLIATLFDESLARTAILSLPSKIGVTANLKVNYRAPLPADQFIMIKSTLNSLNGRKAFVNASLTSLDSKTLFADAQSLFIEPKYAHLLKSSGVTEALGGKVTEK